MAAYAELAMQNPELGDNPVEMLVVGCPLATADSYANALRNQGQAAHVKIADSLDSLDQQMATDPCEIVVINADTDSPPCIQAIGKIRALLPTSSIVLVAADPLAHKKMAIEHGLQDLVNIEDVEHLSLAIQREHQTLMLRRDVERLSRMLNEAEETNNILVESSRDAIAYMHEGMYLKTNQAYLDLFGYESFDEIDGLPIMDMIDTESRTAFKAALRKLTETGKHSEEFRCVTADGESFSARMEFSPASIDDEQCTQVVVYDQSQSLELQKRIEELTSKDAQTGFLNRQAFMERLEGLVSGAEGSDTDHSLIQLSITNYADMRENCGFDCAEGMLGEVAGVLSSTVPQAFTIARFGDHDFMIVSSEEEPALQVAERCLQSLRSHAFNSIKDSPVTPIYSVGVTRAEKGMDITAHELINRSCRATGIARTEGENRVVFYSDQIPGDTTHMAETDAAMVKQIDQALANDGFRLKYQPIVSLQGDTRENYSVYLRMVGEDGKELEPETFLSQAHDANRLAEIDRWVVRNAIRELASHRRNGKKVIFYVILSRAGIEDDSMLLWICDCLREFRAKGAWLVFQFRETDLRSAIQPARELIDGLKKINCNIAINNYVDNEANQALIKQFTIDIVKLAPEYMRDLATQSGQQDKMNAVNRKLQEDGYKTIASGVEDANSLAILWNTGINYIQGYFLQEPSSAISFDEEQQQ